MTESDDMFDFARLVDDKVIGEPPPVFGRDIVAWEPPLVLTASEWCDRPDPEHVSILGALISESSRLVVGGDSGHGKTTLVMQMVHAVATGDEFLGMQGCGGPVLILDLEQSERTLKRRLVEMKLDRAKNVVIVRAPEGMDLKAEVQYSWVLSLIEKAEADGNPYKMVVIDPVYKAHTGDSNSEREVVDLMMRVDHLRERFGFGLVIPMHVRKGAGIVDKLTMNDIFGSNGFYRGAEVIIGIQRREGNKSRLYFFKDRDGDLEEHIGEQREWNLWFNREEGFMRAADDVKFLIPATEIILEYMTDTPHSVTKPQIVQATGLSDKRTDKGLKNLLAKELIVKLEERGERNAVLYALPSNAIVVNTDKGTRVDAIDSAIGEG